MAYTDYARDFALPEALPEVLSDLTREILRKYTYDPAAPQDSKDIERFCASYFEDLAVSQNESKGADASADVSPAAYLMSLTPEQIEEMIRNLFLEHDADGNGVLDRQEFKAVFVQLQEQLGLSRRDLLMILSDADENADGMIEYNEFVPVAQGIIESIVMKWSKVQHERKNNDDAEEKAFERAVMLVHGMPREELNAIVTETFHAADADGNGFLDRKEFVACLKDTSLGFTRKEINAILSDVDMDRNGKISYNEFVPLCYDLLVEVQAANILDEEKMKKENIKMFLLDLFSSADAESSGWLPSSIIRDLLLNADLGLPRLHVCSMMSMAQHDANRRISYEVFAEDAAVMISALGNYLDTQAQGIMDMRSAEGSDMVIGLDEAGLQEMLSNCLGPAAENGELHYSRVHELLEGTELTEGQIWAIISLGTPAPSGDPDAVDINAVCANAFRLLKREEELHYLKNSS